MYSTTFNQWIMRCVRYVKYKCVTTIQVPIHVRFFGSRTFQNVDIKAVRLLYKRHYK